MTQRSKFKQSDVTRALKGALATGLMPSGYRVDTLGRIEVTLDNGAPKPSSSNPWDAEL